MSLLKPALEGSTVLRPLVRLAEVPAFRIESWLKHSRLFKAVSRVGEQGLSPLRALGRRFPLQAPQGLAMLTFGVALLFWLMSFQTTGIIGAFTGLLFIAMLGLTLLFPTPLSKRFNVADVLVLCFFLSAVLSTAFSSYFLQSLIGLAKMLTVVAGYTVFRTVVHDNARPVLMLLGVLLLLGVGESLIGFYQHLNHIQPLATWVDPSTNPELQMTRVFGTLKPYNPNLLAGFLIPTLAAGLGLTLIFFSMRKWSVTLVSAVGSLLILVALVMTGSRGGYLAIGAISATFFAVVGHLIWHERSLKTIRSLKTAWLVILIGALLAVAIGFAGSEKLRHRVVSIFSMREDSSIAYRMNVYDSASRMFRDNPVVGIGPGNDTFKQVYGLYMTPGYNALGAYSVPLEIAVEQGVIGLLVFAALLGVLVLRTALFVDAADPPLQEKMLAGLLLAGILGSFVYGFFDTIWYRPSVNLLFWFFVAALASLTEKVITERALRNSYK